MKRFIALLFLGLAIISCKEDGPVKAKGGKVFGGTIVYSEKNEVVSLNTHLIDDESARRIANQVFEGLVKLNPSNLKVMPSLAKFSYNDDEFTYSFILKQGVYFHDNSCFPENKGRLVKVSDVVYSFERICKKQMINGAYINNFKGIVVGAEDFHNGKTNSIKGIKEVNDSTLTIKLTKHSNAFLKKLTSINYAIVPREGIEAYGDNNVVGTGPFEVESFSKAEHIVLVKNKKYHGYDKHGNRLPYIDKVEIDFNKRLKQQINDFFAKEQNLVLNLPHNAIKKVVGEHIDHFKEDSLSKLQMGKLLSTYYLEFNRSNKFLANKQFRKAINYAIDRRSICEQIFGMSQMNIGKKGITHPSLSGYKTDRIQGYNYNPELAKKLLDSCEFGEEAISLEIEITDNDFRAQRIINELEVQLRQNLGIQLTVNISPQPLKMMKARNSKGDIFFNSYLAQYPSPESFLWLFYGASVPENSAMPSYPNTSRYVNPAFDHKFLKARKSIAQEDSYRNFAVAEKIMMEDAPIAVLWYDETNALLDASVQGFPHNNLLHFDLSRVYLKDNKEVRKEQQEK